MAQRSSLNQCGSTVCMCVSVCLLQLGATSPLGAGSRGERQDRGVASPEHFSKHLHSVKRPLHIHTMAAFKALTSSVWCNDTGPHVTATGWTYLRLCGKAISEVVSQCWTNRIALFPFLFYLSMNALTWGSAHTQPPGSRPAGFQWTSCRPRLWGQTRKPWWLQRAKTKTQLAQE